MRFFTPNIASGALPMIGLLAVTAGAQAQTLNGIRIGEEITVASRIAGKPIARAAAGPHEELRWRLPDGNKLALATDPGNGRIAYAEETWGGQADGKPADFPWLHLWRNHPCRHSKARGEQWFRLRRAVD